MEGRKAAEVLQGLRVAHAAEGQVHLLTVRLEVHFDAPTASQGYVRHLVYESGGCPAVGLPAYPQHPLRILL